MAQNDTPDDVIIPKNWSGIAMWMLGKWGVGAVFLGMVWFLYQDLRESNKQFAAVAQANVAAMTTLVAKLEANQDTMRRVEQAVANLSAKK